MPAMRRRHALSERLDLGGPSPTALAIYKILAQNTRPREDAIAWYTSVKHGITALTY
jgi:hypothetical protein